MHFIDYNMCMSLESIWMMCDQPNLLKSHVSHP
jgi:hypothetical protein